MSAVTSVRFTINNLQIYLIVNLPYYLFIVASCCHIDIHWKLLNLSS